MHERRKTKRIDKSSKIKWKKYFLFWNEMRNEVKSKMKIKIKFKRKKEVARKLENERNKKRKR